MNLNFTYYMPTRLIFGAGTLKELAETPFLPGKKALIVIGAAGAMRKHGYLDTVTKLLAENNVESIVFDKIMANPVEENVMDGAAAARDNGCDFVVGLGGGSSIDAAKSIAVMATNPEKGFRDSFSGMNLLYPRETVPRALPVSGKRSPPLV